MTDTRPEDPIGEILRRVFARPIPHVAHLGISIVESGDRRLVMRLPYQASLVGNPDSGVLHGGAVTTLIDTACGFVAIAALSEPAPVATLDLRVDYLRPAKVGHDLFVEAVCTQRTRHLVFTRAEAYQDDPEAPVATALASLMITGGIAGNRGAGETP